MSLRIFSCYLSVVIGLLFLGTSTQAQSNTEIYKISYLRSSNGKTFPNQDPVIVFASTDVTAITSDRIIKGGAAYPFERFFVDRETNSYHKLAEFGKDRSTLTVDNQLLSKQNLVITNETKTILGYLCRKATTTVNSNSIELWFTDALPVKGAPTELGQNLGVVLEMVRNGNTKTTATEITKVQSLPVALELPTALHTVDELTYKDLLWRSRFIDLSIFTKEQINFVNEVKSDSVLRFANGTIILKKVKVPVISKGSNVFLELTEQSNGDAYSTLR